MFGRDSCTSISQFSMASQDDCNSFDFTPADMEYQVPPSPQRKKRGPRMRMGNSEDGGEVGMFQNMLSQDSMPVSQIEWSQQDMSDRMGTLNFRASEDNCDSMSYGGGNSGGGHGHGHGHGHNNTRLTRQHSFTDDYVIKSTNSSSTPHESSHLSRQNSFTSGGGNGEMSFMRRVVENKENERDRNSGSSTGNWTANLNMGVPPPAASAPVLQEMEKKINIPPPLQNPFLAVDDTSRRSRRPTTIFIAPFRERPRYMSDFDQEGMLGEGVSAVVYKARRRLDGQLYAVKKLKLRIQGETHGLLATKEACALSVLQGCPHIMRYFGCWIEDSHLWIQTELCMPITLEDYIAPAPVSPDDSASFELPQNQAMLESPSPSHTNAPNIALVEPAIWRVARSMCEALAFMHSKNIAHLDIRTSNILIRDPEGCIPRTATRNGMCSFALDGIITGRIEIAVGDFGNCSRLDDEKALEGAEEYCALELIDHRSGVQLDLTKCDMFSLGATLYELMRGYALRKSGSEEWHYLRRGQLEPAVLSRFSSTLRDMVHALMAPSPADRPSASHCLNAIEQSQGGSSKGEDLMARIALLEAENRELVSQLHRMGHDVRGLDGLREI
jgi:serine/threonine protein kinase